MADIFISYAREDAAKVERLAPLLTAAGYSAWWDNNLTSGARYLKETEAELKAAKAVLVIWSKASVDSHWVADEAAVGRDENCLAAISFDGSMPPLGFRQFQVTDFTHWKGGAQEPPFASLVGALARLIAPSSAVTPPTTPNPRKPIPRRMLMIGGLAAAALAVIAAVAMFTVRPQASQATTAPITPRIAFFGFTAGSDDPVLSGIAETATNEVFQALSAQQVEMAARADTVGPQQKTRIDRAAELGARFALSGEVRPETGSGRVSISMRLEDVTARTALWEEAFADDASAPLPVAVRAASRASDVGSCLVRYFSRLGRSSADKDLLATIAAYCPSARSNPGPATNRALRKLSQLAPKDGDMQGALASNLLVFTFPTATPAARPALLNEAKQALTSAMAVEPNSFRVAYVRYRLGLVERQPWAEIESILTTSLRRTPEGGWEVATYSLVNSGYGNLLSYVGRVRSALPYFLTATEGDPLYAVLRYNYARALAAANRPEAGDLLQQAFARQPTIDGGETLLGSAVLLGAGDADKLLASPPKGIDPNVVQCWRDIHNAVKAGNQTTRAKAAARTRTCLKEGRLLDYWAVAALARLDDLDDAFGIYDDLPGIAARPVPTAPLFWPTSRAMRADPRFRSLVEKLGLMDYWRTTKTQPDVCETEDMPFCRELKKAAKP